MLGEKRTSVDRADDLLVKGAAFLAVVASVWAWVAFNTDIIGLYGVGYDMANSYGVILLFSSFIAVLLRGKLSGCSNSSKWRPRIVCAAFLIGAISMFNILGFVAWLHISGGGAIESYVSYLLECNEKGLENVASDFWKQVVIDIHKYAILAFGSAFSFVILIMATVLTSRSIQERSSSKISVAYYSGKFEEMYSKLSKQEVLSREDVVSARRYKEMELRLIAREVLFSLLVAISSVAGLLWYLGYLGDLVAFEPNLILLPLLLWVGAFFPVAGFGKMPKKLYSKWRTHKINMEVFLMFLSPSAILVFLGLAAHDALPGTMISWYSRAIALEITGDGSSDQLFKCAAAIFYFLLRQGFLISLYSGLVVYIAWVSAKYRRADELAYRYLSQK